MRACYVRRVTEHRLTSALPLAECRARLTRLPATPPEVRPAHPVICGRVRGTSVRLFAETPHRRTLTRRYFYGAMSASPEGTLIVGHFRRSTPVRLAARIYVAFLLLYVSHAVLLAGAIARQQLGKLLLCGALVTGLVAWVRLKRGQEDRRMLELLADELDARPLPSGR